MSGKAADGVESLLAFILGVGAVFYSAFVFTCLWRWFVVPLGVPGIGMAHSIGLLCVLSWTKNTNVAPHKEGLELVGIQIFFVTTLWGIGALARAAM